MKKGKKIRWIVGVFALALLLTYFTQKTISNSRYIAHFDLPKNRNEAWQQDLSHFQNNYFSLCKSFPKDSIFKANQIIDSLKRNIDGLSDNQIKLLISKCVSMADDGHTSVYLGKFRNIPLKFYLFDDGLYVVKAKSGYEQFLGSRVNKIGDRKIEEIIEDVDAFMPGNESWIKYKSSHFLGSPDFLEGIGLAKDIDAIKYEFVNGKDTLITHFSPEKKYDTFDEYESWRNLTPSNKIYADTVNSWLHVLTKQTPVYLSNPNIPGFTTPIESLKALYIQINMSTEIPNLLEEVKSSVEDNNVQNLIVDLRFNTGGNYLKQAEFSKEIPKLVKGKIFIVTGNATFSAGICTAARLKYFAKEQAVVIGQEIGDGLTFWAEGKSFYLPNSKLPIRVTTGFHDWESNKYVPFKTHWLNIFYGVPVTDLKPDIFVSNYYDDYIKGTDKILEEIKQHLHNKG
ncbi:S41 family peptidase [Xanthovirga aplysinae]|uniref:S41 family peptidase n=1 Tax=Xanthovirga aplysinae TaxID=2529853 RepID=UPI0012BC5438|nr:S41 family peptidase [Xanthovirga aplysinae]MTI30136.1 hypothetical protein [Xanthovirga aplysinae]